MSLLKVARMGHPVLRARAREIDSAELKRASMQKLIDDMIDTMHEYHGVGLAAPQIHEGLRILVAAIAPENEDPLSPDDEPMVFINPVITPAGPEIVEELPEDTHGLGKSFDDEVEAEVAELLGEIEPPAVPESESTDDEKH